MTTNHFENSPAVRHAYADVDGLRLFFREAGQRRAGAPTLLLLHGFPSSSHMFRRLLPALADRFHLVAPDYPGFGLSDAPSPADFSYTFDHLAEVVERFSAHLGLTRYLLYLQDYGSPVGFRLATRRPEAVAGLIVQNAVAHEEGLGDGFGAVKAIWADRNAKTEQGIRELLAPEFTKLQYTAGRASAELVVEPEAWLYDQHFLDRAGNDAIQIELQYDYRHNPPLYPQWQRYLREHRPPTLVVWGRHDPLFTVAGALAYLRDLADARVELHLLEAGHFALEEEGELIAGLILRFFRKA